MTAPTPLLRPSPLDVSALFSASFEALKRRLGLFLMLVLAPTLLTLIVILVAFLIGGGGAVSRNTGAVATAVIVAGLVAAVGTLAAALLQLKTYGMMALGAYEIAQGQRPDFQGLLARTKGYLPRMVSLILMFVGLVIAFYLIFFGVLFAAFRNGSDTAAGVVVGLMFLVFLVGVPLSVFLWTRLLYLVPIVAIERVSGIDAMKRSFALTKGEFWRTLGYALLPALAIWAISFVINMITNAFSPSLASQFPSGSGTSPAEMFTLLLATLPVMLLSIVLQLAVSLFTTPFIQIYTTYMYVDQVRRKALPQYGYAPGGYGGQGFPQAYPGQSQPYPGQAQQYPGQAQQYPGQAQQYPGQGQQYPGQGQQYPGQGQQYPGQGQNQWPGQN